MIGRLTPFAFVAGLLNLAAAALLAGWSGDHPRWWGAALALAILGGITPLIYGVNVRVVPVFSRRAWRDPSLLAAAIGGAAAGGWLMAIGRARPALWAERAGAIVALLGAFAFVAAIGRLFSQPAGATPAPPLPAPEQSEIDKIAVQFTRFSSMLLLVGLGVGVLRTWWTPTFGRWELVWAHALLVGFFLCMAQGTGYHVLGRWTTARWRSVALIRWHWRVTAVALPLMLVALASGWRPLFMVAGPLQALAIALWLIHAAPLLARLPGPSRPSALLAVALLLTGVTLGASFALDAVLGVRLRQAHADINLFGFTGLLITAFGLYLAPRFAGRPLLWPRLVPVQQAAMTLGAVGGATAFAWRAYGDAPSWAVPAAHLLLAAGYLLLAALMGGPFLMARRTRAAGQVGAVNTIALTPRGDRTTPLRRA